MKKQTYSHGIILPLKESFFKKNCGAVSLYVNEFLKKKIFESNYNFCK